MTTSRIRRIATVVLITIIAAAATWLTRVTLFAPKTITAYFTHASSIYPRDQVRVAGVAVGTIEAIHPEGTQTRVTMQLDRKVPIPANTSAVIVAPNLVSARYIQLVAPSAASADVIADGALIPLDRTAVPVDWDEVKQQLTRLATDLGPHNGISSTSAARFVDSAANAMNGNGDKLRQTLAELSGVGRILADGGGNIADILKNLQVFVSALKESNVQIVQFQNRFATLTSTLDNSRSELDAALTNLSAVTGEIQTFVAGTRDKTSEQLQRLTNVTQTLVDHRKDLEQVLHVAPHALANTVNMFDPQMGSGAGAFVLTNFSNPVQFICSAIGAVANVTASETGKLCAQYLGPGLNAASFNMLPFPINPFLAKSPPPEDLIYSEPGLMPGGAGPTPGPPEIPPAISAYDPAPGTPHPDSLPEMLLPAAQPPPPAEPQPGTPPQPTGTPPP
ncbi:MCE family protein [Mycolicibacterium septicum DSM 44393]|uniref:MCE family protein n=1 Tax=Mycolicibacterium septicum DSM 44393 TaxID=1341646 RepID=A0A7X6RVD6_9MYCO|nr:MCE family protein [Mycolicibacterium septicum]NKZ10867.1 MCE family protein [Mycolicibacterium septicum DSM 44393]